MGWTPRTQDLALLLLSPFLLGHTISSHPSYCCPNTQAFAMEMLSSPTTCGNLEHRPQAAGTGHGSFTEGVSLAVPMLNALHTLSRIMLSTPSGQRFVPHPCMENT